MLPSAAEIDLKLAMGCSFDSISRWRACWLIDSG
jgi:hypothetical protein